MKANPFGDILEVEQHARILNIWEDDEEKSEDIYDENALTGEDDDVEPFTAGVMLGYIAG